MPSSDSSLWPSAGLEAQCRLLKSRLNQLRASETVIFSDMTSTLLYQGPGGFPRETRGQIRRFLDAGGTLVLVTGDTWKIINAEFFERLDYRGSQRVYVISGAGHLIYEWKEGLSCALLHGPSLKDATKRKALALIESLISEFLHLGFRFDAQQLSILLAQEGGRVDIGPALGGCHSSVLVEGSPCKVTVFLPEAPLAEGIFSKFLDALVADSSLVECARQEGLHLVRGGNFVDFIATRKEDGLKAFFSLPAAGIFEMSDLHVIAIGDSANDKGILNFPYPSLNPALRIFVGNSEEFVSKEIIQAESPDFFFLKDSYIRGAQFVFSAITN